MATDQEPVVIDDFIAAKKFDGKRNGMVFTCGAEGLGYYRDGPKPTSIAQAFYPSSRIEPISLDSNTLISAFSDDKSTVAATFEQTNRDSIAKGKDRGSRRKGPLSCTSTRKGVNSDAAEKVMKGLALHGTDKSNLSQCIPADSKVHRKLGCWAIDTANGNCWARAATYIKSSRADFVVAQEAKLAEGAESRNAEQS